MVIVFGSINLDYIGRVQQLPKAGESVRGSDLLVAPGGKGANQALAAARAGARVRLVGSVGDDAAAETALALLRDAKVDLRNVEVRDTYTGTALILVDAAGENSIAVLPGANGTTAAADLSAAGVGPRDLVLFQMELDIEETCRAIAHAHEAGATTVVNLAPYVDLDSETLGKIDVLIVNEIESRGLCGLPPEAPIEQICSQLSEVSGKYEMRILATFGADGAYAIGAGERQHFESPAVDVVDTVGAGDTFSGYIAAALAQKLPLDQAMQSSVNAASLACTRSGAQPSIPWAGRGKAI